MTADENYRLLMEIQANRDFLWLAYRQNPELLRFAEPGVRRLFGLPEMGSSIGTAPALGGESTESSGHSTSIE